jgi:DNA-binding GntR family transcriptional regulator
LSENDDLDWKFHDVLAEATGNVLLVEIQRIVNRARRAVVWGHLEKRPVGPEADYHSIAEHDAIIDAIAKEAREGAA